VCRRASTSEDVTMATWGGSTAGNLESIDEDDDDDDDDDDDTDQVAAAGQNGKQLISVLLHKSQVSLAVVFCQNKNILKISGQKICTDTFLLQHLVLS